MQYSTEADAELAGKAALKKMPRRAGWRLDVWENLGWHYALRNGRWTVYPVGEVFHVMLADRDNMPSTGSTLWTTRPAVAHADPHEAVKAQLKIARETVRELELGLRKAARQAGVEW